MIATAQRAPGGGAGATRAPAPVALWAIALAGVAGSAVTAALILTTERTTEPEWQAGLLAWIVLTYTVGGAVAWWRRPDSRFGPLMVAAGATMFLSSLWFADAPALFTLGQAFDLVPAAIFLHVSLAYPGGRVGGVAERAIVAVAYVCAVGLQVVNLTLGNYGPDNLLEVTQDPDAGLVVTRVQLTTLSACMLAGVVVLVVRRSGGGPAGAALGRAADRLLRPRPGDDRLPVHQRRLGQVAFPWVQRATLFAIGLAPLAFLIGLLEARLARSSVGDLFVDLRAEPSPRRAARRAGPDPARPVAGARLLAARVRDLRRPRGAGGRAARSLVGARRDHIERDGRERGGARPRPVAARRARAARGRRRRRPASRSRTRACRWSCGPASRSCAARGPASSRPASASASGSSATCTTAPSSASSRCRWSWACWSSGLGGDREAGARIAEARRRDRHLPGGAARDRARPAPRRASAATASPWPSSSSPPGPRCR